MLKEAALWWELRMLNPDCRVRIGTSGWSYEDWHGPVYPTSPRPRDELHYLAAFFDAIEVNSSFYRPPAPKVTESWVRRVQDFPDFRFTFKMHQRFTHERDKPWTPAEAGQFKDAVQPVREAERLGAVLLQFPWSFRSGEAGYGWLHHLAEEFHGWPLVVEVRHDSWLSEEAMSALELLKLPIANIDQPSCSHCITPDRLLVTSSLNYVRLHGRNHEKWFKDGAGRDERYDYLYNERELDEWVARIRELSRQSKEIYVFTNNHYRGQAPANALQLMAKLRRKQVAIPEPMLASYPFLADIAAPPEDATGAQGQLF